MQKEKIDTQHALINAVVQNIATPASSLCIISTDIHGAISINLNGKLSRDKQALTNGLLSALSELEKIESPNC